LAKKFVIADRLGSYVQAVENPGGLYYGSFVLWLSMVFYFIQLYADFSGYSDMAIGCARLVGVKLPPNFNRPLGADSVTEFWRRWHISFSNWLRDYIYMPLFIHFRNLGTVAMIGSLLATFLLCGIWHGLGVTFAVFGLAHGIAMSVEALTKKTRSRLLGFWPARVGQTLGIAYTFVFCASAAVLFRANSLADALQFYQQLLAFMPLSGVSELFAYKGPFMFLLTVFAALLILVVDQPAEKLVGAKHPWVKSFALAALILVLGKGAGGEFIYEQF
jgi:D-alanyl-lipoteichoic acid acyltransferase DltB (MBOAT superfamily)